MLLNTHSYYSLRYGTLSLVQLVNLLVQQGYDTTVLTDINNSSAVLDFLKLGREKGLTILAGMEFRTQDKLLYIAIAKNTLGFEQINRFRTEYNLAVQPLPEKPPLLSDVFFLFPFGTRNAGDCKDNEYIAVKPAHLNKLRIAADKNFEKCVIWQPVTFASKKDFTLHCQLRAIDHNVMLSQLCPEQAASRDEMLPSKADLLNCYRDFPQIIRSTEKLLGACSFDFDFSTPKNKQLFGTTHNDDKLLLEKLAMDGLKTRYGLHNKEAFARVRKELEIIHNLNFSAYFLITHDIVSYATSRGFFYVGRGSGANSVVAYCLRITDVCPIELDLYFERFMNPNRKSPPDFDVDFCWDERDEMYDYIFKRYGTKNTALLGAMSTFKDNSVIREMSKVYGLPKGETDRILNYPNSTLNNPELNKLLHAVRDQIAGFPNLRTIHSSGVLISELPLTNYAALDLPPKGLPTAQFDMYTAEDIGFEKFDILSQRGIGHIKECASLIEHNRGEKIKVYDFHSYKKDPKINDQLQKGETVGCFYIESPSMHQVLRKLECNNYLTLVAASSIIRPGVGSGMMGTYIQRSHASNDIEYLHPIMEEQLKETFGVMIYQEDVLKIGHYFGGLTLGEADVLRRMMSGKTRSEKHLLEIEGKYFANCAEFGYSPAVAAEVWRQIKSFAGYSFSKAHSASFAVESYMSLHLKTYYPIEFYCAVINNDGGFYATHIYVREAAKSGAIIHCPCVNHSLYKTTLEGKNLYLGFKYVHGLETNFAEMIPAERLANGPFTTMEDFIRRTAATPEIIDILIRIGAFRFTAQPKKELQWQAVPLVSRLPRHRTATLFASQSSSYILPTMEGSQLEDIYDEIELLGFPVSGSLFDMLETSFRGDVLSRDLKNQVGKKVRMVGEFVCEKPTWTKYKEVMKFGRFYDIENNFIDTIHFPPSLQVYPLKGWGVYLMLGTVKEEFEFQTVEVEKIVKLPVRGDPRSE